MNYYHFPYSDFGVNQFFGWLALYCYIGFTVMTLANRLGVKRSWMAWVPIANFYLLTKMAQRQWWFMFGFFVPIVNIFVLALLWSDIAQHFKKSPWIGIAIVIPVVGLLVPAYLVFTTKDASHHHPHAH